MLLRPFSDGTLASTFSLKPLHGPPARSSRILRKYRTSCRSGRLGAKARRIGRLRGHWHLPTSFPCLWRHNLYPSRRQITRCTRRRRKQGSQGRSRRRSRRRRRRRWQRQQRSQGKEGDKNSRRRSRLGGCRFEQAAADMLQT